jgi:hypothetical protein
MAAERAQVAVIGAGIAGLSAARELARLGRAVTVFDKGRGPGGRIATRRAAPFLFDHGAQYFTVRDPSFASAVDAWRSAGVVDLWRGRIVAFEQGLVRASSDVVERFVGVPDMNSLPKFLARDLDVRCSVKVARAERLASGWALYDEHGVALGEFAQVLATLPHAQLIELFPHSASLTDRARASVVRPCWAVLAGFEARLPLDFDGAFCNDATLAWIARNTSKPQRPEAEAWVLHASAEWSAANLELEPRVVAEEVLRAFERLAGRALPRPVQLDAHRWRYAIPEASKGPTDTAWLDKELGLAVAGDGCTGGRVEGAFLSGRRAAELLARA